MFKSVFAKYIWTFMLIVLCSFVVIIAVVSSIIVHYSQSSKSDIMKTAAHSSATFLQSKLAADETVDLAALVQGERNDIETMLSVVCVPADDMTIMVTDNTGCVLMVVGRDHIAVVEHRRFPLVWLREASAADDIRRSVELPSVYEGERAICAVPVYDSIGLECGTVVVSTPSMLLTDLLNVVVQTLVAAILMILLATLIAVYLITQRVTVPLREISRAAKQFSTGKFDTRVEVRGKDEIAELAVTFNSLAESMANYDDMRNSFMSNVSHDLRSPMTSISGFIDGILDGVIPPEKHRYYLQIVSSEIHRLSRLVASLLDLSRIQAGERKFTMAPFDICEMGREILISFEAKIDEKKLEVEFDCSEDRIRAVADRDAIYQVFYNLCDNAIKFSSVGGLLRIQIQKMKNRRVMISVYNEGQGVSPADLPYVFEQFYKSDKSRGLNKTGVGLGLFISKTIIDAHHEEIGIESEFGKNCCFHFTLPVE